MGMFLIPPEISQSIDQSISTVNIIVYSVVVGKRVLLWRKKIHVLTFLETLTALTCKSDKLQRTGLFCEVF